MVNHKDDWRQQPRMGKRKRQVLSILDDAYEYDRAFASRYADLLSEEEATDPAAWSWRSRAEIFHEAAEEDLPPPPWPDLPVLPLTRMIFEIAPEDLRAKYDEMARRQARLKAGSSLAEAWEGWKELRAFEVQSMMPLRHGEAFKERWDTLRRGLNLAVKALERDGLIKGAINPDDGLVYFRITPAGREAIAFR